MIYGTSDNNTQKEKHITSDVIQNLIKRRENVLSGGINCIPFPFERFRQDIPGIEQYQYVIVTASTKVGKTQLASYLYLYTILEYCFNNKDKCSCHIIYFALEESPDRIIERYLSHLLWHLDNIHIAPTDLRSTDASNPIPQDVLNLLQTKPYLDRRAFFEECVQFETEETSSISIKNICSKYAAKTGTVKGHYIETNGKKMPVIDSYTPNDPNHYKVVIIDHVSLIDQAENLSKKQSIDKLSEYCVKYLRNIFGYTCVIIQQQSFENEGLEAVKQKHLMPNAASLSDTKYTARDADLVLGLFSPDKFGIANYMGYDITLLRNNVRFMSVIANRNGVIGGICPLFFDGEICDFKELPFPEDPKINDFYKEAEIRQKYRQQRKLLCLLNLIKTKFTLKNERNNLTDRTTKSSKLQSSSFGSFWKTKIRKIKHRCKP